MDRHLVRRDLLRLGLGGLAFGFFGLHLPTTIFLREASGLVPQDAFYDAMIQIFYRGGPSQTDTWDPKPGSPNNRVGTIRVGADDIYKKPIFVADHFTRIVDAVRTSPAIGLGILRSIVHGNGAHEPAERWMNCFWASSAEEARYPAVQAVMAHYFQGQGATGIPAVMIDGSNGDGANEPKTARVPTALVVAPSGGNGQDPTVEALSLPQGVDAQRYARRRRLLECVNEHVLATRPDDVVRAYDRAWKEAHDITVKGAAAKAFDLAGKALLPGGPDARPAVLERLTLAQELVKAGVPYVAVGIGDNDTHSNNRRRVGVNWGDITDVAVSAMAKNLAATGRRTLIVMGGEFGRGPADVQQRNGNRDGRDHFPDGFSWALLSINQPKFKTTAIGDTGPDGMDGRRSKDTIQLRDLGGFLYRVMGFDVGKDPRTEVPLAARPAPPVDRLHEGDKLRKWLGLV